MIRLMIAIVLLVAPHVVIRPRPVPPPPPVASCGELGGNICLQTVSCPDGTRSLGPSYDCQACCLSLNSPRR